MENNNQIDIKFGKKLIFPLWIPRDIYKVLGQNISFLLNLRSVWSFFFMFSLLVILFIVKERAKDEKEKGR